MTPGATRVESALRAASRRGEPALAAFLTGGYPRPDGFHDLLLSVAREVDVVEVGVPFSDPIADGVTLQRSSRIALQQGVTLRRLLRVVEEAALPAPVLFMSYLNPLLRFGLDALAREAAVAGVDGFIGPDLPLEEAGPMRAVLEGRGLALVQLVTPVTPPGRLEALCRSSRGFVYAVALTGTTGAALHTADAPGYLERVRAASTVPVLAGFGVRNARQVRELAPRCDGVVVGTALVETIERGSDPCRFLRSLRTGAATPRGRPP